jgi:hypothetical protein
MMNEDCELRKTQALSSRGHHKSSHRLPDPQQYSIHNFVNNE